MWSGNKNTKFTTWFYRVVLNACEDLRRKNKRNMHQDIDTFAEIYGEEASQENGMVVSEDQLVLEKAIAGLPERQKEALNLVVYEELKQKDAADVLGVGIKALESLLSRAKKTLKETLNKDQNREEKNYAAR